MEGLVYKFVLQNAVRYGGKASAGAIIGKLLSEDPSLKVRMAEVSKEIAAAVRRVNSMSLRDQVHELEHIAPELLEERKKEEGPRLKPLEGAVKGRVVMRVAPSPSGPLHVGHAYILALTSELCRMYDGKMILRIEDTNPENIYEPAYRMIPEDASWVTMGRVDEVVVQSDRLKQYYDSCHALLVKGHAYVCMCDADAFRELASRKEACPCRSLAAEENLRRWDRMFLDFKPGEAVVRVKTDVAHPNPAVRDWPAFRINDHVHPRTGSEHRVWPLMNFAVASS